MLLKLNTLEFQLLRGYIQETCGVALADTKAYLIESRLAELVTDSGCRSFGEFYRKLKQEGDPALRDRLVDAITTKETMWFRDDLPWQALRSIVLPALRERSRVGRQRRFRIWSAGCATGQEPYSMAMLIADFCARQTARVVSPEEFEVIGTDISNQALEQAQAATYDDLAMSRGLTGDWLAWRSQYFDIAESGYVLRPSIKNRVKFRRHNLQDSLVALLRFDIVLLRNVLIYFSPPTQRDLILRMQQTVAPGGYLFLGVGEGLGGTPGFAQQAPEAANYYLRLES